MRFRAIENFKIRTPQGETEILAGQVLNMGQGQAIPLIHKGKVEPADPAIIKMYSRLLEETIWLVPDDRVRQSLIDQGTQEPIFTMEECKTVVGLDVRELVFLIRKTFPGAKIRVKRLEHNHGNL